jgi:catechol 2,3-dioxygenase-like lactoylglutathione lyase family enzyme
VPAPTIDELFIAAEPAAWLDAGFDVEDDFCDVGTVRLRFGASGRGIVAWSVRDTPTLELDGLDTSESEAPPVSGGTHPNGTRSIDHVVVITPDLDRTTAVLQEAGFDLRRLREGDTPGGSRRQAFFRMGELILELVEAPEGTRVVADPSGPARLWGISFLVDDLDAPARVLGDALGEPRDAVQPGRRIATLADGAALGPAIAFMTPGPGAI